MFLSVLPQVAAVQDSKDKEKSADVDDLDIEVIDIPEDDDGAASNGKDYPHCTEWSGPDDDDDAHDAGCAGGAGVGGARDASDQRKIESKTHENVKEETDGWNGSVMDLVTDAAD